ncbi:hypothetical protein [Castellaniella sp.]|uniref:hypothetical protein n=1 Tax=Castellaniella sp. TaxID=1955812 RepID=UPI003C74C300
MASPKRYPSTPVGELLGHFYNHRSVLRRTIPLFAITAKDLARALKGEIGMAPGEPARCEPQHPHAGASHASRRHAHAS